MATHVGPAATPWLAAQGHVVTVAPVLARFGFMSSPRKVRSSRISGDFSDDFSVTVFLKLKNNKQKELTRTSTTPLDVRS